ncbi:hypothetical protein [Kribbella kalugense]|uniref:Uncharacterized protein n=1 Tax=Kribbella kalugense TaxID=2512221 RepID=A0A4R7ZNK1_9ACTN|nr:hypothetical protein [Kribbella kalugense]TDW19447.1 hypothetical protein EV650_6056 [Kribbella kalugense]
MTLVLTARGRDTLWLVVDRRLSFGGSRPPIDDAMKVMDLDTLDGRGLLAYAGLGATARGTQPSAWMSAVLRGRGGLMLEQALDILSDAATRELPRHLVRTPAGAHTILIPAFVQGVGARLYAIDNIVDPKTKEHRYRYTRHERPGVVRGSRAPSVVVAGTGGVYLQSRGEAWVRSLFHLINAHDQGKVSDLLVADQLAALSYEAHHAVRDGSVGPRCIVVWRRRPDARPGPGGGHQAYTGLGRDANSEGIPTISNGFDVSAITGIMMKQILDQFAGGSSPQVALDLDTDELNRLLGELPEGPDEKLR